MKLRLDRDTFTDTYTLGRFYAGGKWLGYTCEDTDRKLEDGVNVKVQDETAIPRGTYEVVLSFSHHFNRVLPEVRDVPGFAGIRIHGGNTVEDTEGCVLLGSMRTKDGVANCSPILQRLHSFLEQAEAIGETTTLKIT